MTSSIFRPTRTLLLAAQAACLAACAPEPAATAPATTVPAVAPDSVALMVPHQFLRWYAPLADSLNVNRLGNTTHQYTLPLANTERHLARLRRSGYFSAGYLARRRQQFQQVRERLRREPQFEDPIDGLIPIILTEEDDMLGSLLNTRPELRYYGPDSARVEIMSTDDLLQELESLAFRLVPVGGRWYIDDIRLYSQPLPRRMRPDTVRQANYPR